MQTEFSKLFNYIKKLKSRYLNILGSYTVYDSLGTLVTPNKIGKDKASRNVKIINGFKYFFYPVRESCRCYFLIELAKFFDKNIKSLTLLRVLDYSEENVDKLQKENFLEYHKKRNICSELFKDYKEITLTDIKKLRKRLTDKKNIIKRLKDYRDQYLAHDDIEKIKISVSAREIKEILKLIKNIIEFYYLKLDFSSNYYNFWKEETVNDTKNIVYYLQKIETDRHKEIKKLKRNKE